MASTRIGAVAHDRVLCERLARHGLVRRPAPDVLGAVRRTTALQAQDPVAGRLGVRCRSAVVTDADVLRTIDDERTVVKSSLLRGTIHLVAAEDLRWLTSLVGPRLARSFARRWHGLGLTPDLLERTIAALPAVLAGGPLGRAQVMAGLAEAGVVVPLSDPAAATHVLFHATLEGLVCRGPDDGRDATFVLVDQWVPDAPDGPRGDDALAELARRYFAAYSPATAADFTVWSGVPSARAITLIADELTPADVYGRPGYRLGEVEPARGVALLPAFDNYLLGHRDRPFIADQWRREVYVGGVIRPTVLLDGRVVGRWRRDGGVVDVRMFEPASARARARIEDEVDDIGRFLGIDLRAAIC